MEEMFLKAGPTITEVHANRPLVDMSVAMIQADDRFVADTVFPNIGSKHKSDTFWTYDRGYWNRDEMQKRAPGSESAGGRYGIASDSFVCDVWAFHHDVPWQTRSNQDDGLDQDQETVALLSLKAKIRREKSWATSFFTTGVWTTQRTGSATPVAGTSVLFWDDDSSDPIRDCSDLQDLQGELTGFEPNVAVCGAKVWKVLKNHPDIVDRIKGAAGPGNPAIVTRQAVAALLEVDRLIVMKAIENTAKEGATNAHSYIGGKHFGMFYVPPTPGLRTPSAGYTFNWTGYLPGVVAQGQMIATFPLRRNSADRHEIEMAFVQKKIAADLGSFFYNIIQ